MLLVFLGNPFFKVAMKLLLIEGASKISVHSFSS
jgi:hypothetical protein